MLCHRNAVPCTRSELVQTNLGYVEYAHTDVDQFVEVYLESSQLHSHEILGKDTSAVKFGFDIIFSAPPLPSHFITRRTSTCLRTFSMVLPNTALFINLYRFFSKSFLAFVRNCVFNSI